MTPFIARVQIKNYKSIAACDVTLQPLTFLVGVNGAGKSNFLDALRLVADSLRTSLDHAIRDRGGIAEVRRRSNGHLTRFGLRLDFRLPDGADGAYAFDVETRTGGGYAVHEERCYVGTAGGAKSAFYAVQGNAVRSSLTTALPAPSGDRLYLVAASGIEAFRPVYDALSRMGFYNLNPARMRELQKPDAGELLDRDGANLPSVLSRLARTKSGSEVKGRIEEYLSRVVPGLERVDRKAIGPMEALEFRQQTAGARHPERFLAANMSDGTLRALGILTALFQFAGGAGKNGAGSDAPLLVGIEEPEAALHPAAAGLLLDSLRDAARHVQVIVTSHSPDLLDAPDLKPDQFLAVVANQGVTEIGPPDAASRDVLRRQLYTPGELLRLNQLLPDPEAVKATRLRLFERDGAADE